MTPVMTEKLFLLGGFVFLLIPILMVATVVFIYLFDKYTAWHSPFHMRFSMWKKVNPNAKEADMFGGYTTMLARSRYWGKPDAPQNVTSLSPARKATARVRKEINSHRS